MATKTQAIASALNSAKSSNIMDKNESNRDKLRSLIEEYLYQSEEEGEIDPDSEEEAEEDLLAPGPSTSTSTVEEEALASTSAAVGEDEDEDEDDDDDLVIVQARVVEDIPSQYLSEGDAEVEKVNTFDCKCKFKLADGRTGCFNQFDDKDYVLNMRLSMNEMTNDEKDFLVMGLLLAHGTQQTERTLHLRASRRTERKLPRRHYSLDGKPVCRDAFKFILCLGQNRLSALQKHPLESRRKERLGGRQYNVRSLTAETVLQVTGFIQSFTEDHGLCLPGRIPGYKRADLKLLPSYFTKARLWKIYKKAAADEGHRVVGITSFKVLWRQHLPFIVVARPMTDLCNVCQTNNTRILRGANTTDPNKLALLETQRKHLHAVNIEREFYNSIVAESRATAARLGLGELGQHPPNTQDISMGYCFDFAQQVHLPSSPMQPGPIYFMTPRKCGIFGVCCPAIPQQVNFLIDEGMSCGKGSNAVISYLHFFFEKYGLGETEAVLHCDNCSGQNKNNYMLFYLMWRVLHGYHTKISLNFMVPGHTKFAPDWCFGLLKQNFRRMEVHCLQDMCRAVTESAEKLNKAQLVGHEDGRTVYVPAYDWQTFLSPYFNVLKGIKSLYHFKFEHGLQTITARSTEGEEITHKLLKADLLPPIELPDPVPPPGLPPNRKKYLFTNIRQFVRDDCKDLLCPESESE